MASVRLGLIFASMLFLIYINDLSNDIKIKCKLFADDTSLFSVVHDPTTQAQEIIFSRKKTVSIHPVVYFINTPVNSTATHKHLGIALDSKLSYENHLQSVFSRVNKTIDLFKKFQPNLPRKSLLTIYQSFIRPRVDYGEMFYD